MSKIEHESNATTNLRAHGRFEVVVAWLLALERLTDSGDENGDGRRMSWGCLACSPENNSGSFILAVTPKGASGVARTTLLLLGATSVVALTLTA